MIIAIVYIMGCRVTFNESLESILMRHPSLPLVLAWMESNESWAFDNQEIQDDLDPIVALMESMTTPVLSHDDARIASNVMEAVHASAVLLVIDWMDRNPDNSIGDLFLSKESPVSDSMKQRMRHMLLILLRADLLSKFFNREHLLWIVKHIQVSL